MKVLLAHNFYLQPGGEDTVFRNEMALLKDNGVEVVPFERNNSSLANGRVIDKLKVAAGTAWSERAKSDIAAVLRQARPDIAHFHNTFPMLSPSVYAACAKSGVPVVQTLHNYRTVCPSGTLFRGGQPCEACVGAVPWPSLWHRCYRNSRAGTATVAWMLMRNRIRGVYAKLVHRYIALTEFAAGRFAQGGLPSERIEVKPNFLAAPGIPGPGGGGYAIYVGRLAEEKGVGVLLEAWRHNPTVPLKVVGDGPLRATLERKAGELGLAVEFIGHLPPAEVAGLVERAECLVVPSIWYEGFPMVIVESFARGTPVVASAIGSLDELVQEGETGCKFPPGDGPGLAEAVRRLVGDKDRLGLLRRRVRARFDAAYTPTRNFKSLMAIYARAAQEHRRTNRC